MYRVALVATLAASLAACSLGSSPISSGYADSPATASISSKRSTPSGAFGGDATTVSGSSGQRVAALNDKAPSGTFERAPKGALADRDYTSTSLDAEKARDIINQYRRDKGLKPLKLSTELTEAAKAHSRDLAKWDRISHYGSDGSNPWDRVKRTGYKARLAAENVGTGQVDFGEVFKGWQESPGHNKNLLLTDAQEMGIALVQEPRTEFKSFWTLVLGSSM
ncbi:MAG: CAP domain-containing protein [Hyphomicrobium sp.]